MSTIDKTDVVEALANALDDTRVEGLGFVLLGAVEEEGTLVMQTWPDGDDKPSVDFLLRVTRFRPKPVTTELNSSDEYEGDPAWDGARDALADLLAEKPEDLR